MLIIEYQLSNDPCSIPQYLYQMDDWIKFQEYIVKLVRFFFHWCIWQGGKISNYHDIKKEKIDDPFM